MLMKHKILYLLVLLLLPLCGWAENASNVRVRQKNKDIIITYDLSKTSNVCVFISSGYSYSYILLKAVEGAVGNHVHAGKDLEIIWHPLNEYEKFIADNVRFKVEALGAYDQYVLPKWRKGKQGGKTDMETFILADFAYAFAPQMSGGLTFGQTYSGYGWYINARTNFNFQSATNGLTCSYGGEIYDYSVGSILPFYSGEKKSSTLVVNAGFVMDFIEVGGGSPRNRFHTFGFYAGMGYGWRRMLWETADGKWIEYSPTSYNGFSGNIGLIGSVYGLTLKAGINTINFKYLELEAGIGWMF